MAGLSAYRPTPTSEFRQGVVVDDEASMKMSPSLHRCQDTELERMDFTNVMYNQY